MYTSHYLNVFILLLLISCMFNYTAHTKWNDIIRVSTSAAAASRQITMYYKIAFNDNGHIKYCPITKQNVNCNSNKHWRIDTHKKRFLFFVCIRNCCKLGVEEKNGRMTSIPIIVIFLICFAVSVALFRIVFRTIDAHARTLYCVFGARILFLTRFQRSERLLSHFFPYQAKTHIQLNN